MNAASLDSLHVYPLKSARGIDLARAQLAPTGLAGDRRWMLVDPDGRFLTQREHPRLAVLRALPRDGALELAAPDLPPCAVSTSAPGPSRHVRIWNDDCEAIDAGDTAAAWTSRALGVPCRLVRFDPAQSRLSAREWTDGVSAPNLFSDGFPLLVANRASLEELNARLVQPVPMNRFRPNLVLAGLAPWDEDRIDELRIGAVRLRLVKPCTRCRITTVEQESGTPTGEEPLRTLRTYRYDAALRGIAFAHNAIILEGVGATLATGQEVALRYR
jgi:uncharacterized protein YcbX